MPIEQSRLLVLLDAAGDALAGVDKVGEIVERECRLAREGLIGPGEALRNLELLLSPESLLRDPIGTRLGIERERMKASPRAIRENERKKAKGRAKRLYEKMTKMEQQMERSDE